VRSSLYLGDRGKPRRTLLWGDVCLLKTLSFNCAAGRIRCGRCPIMGFSLRDIRDLLERRSTRPTRDEDIEAVCIWSIEKHRNVGRKRFLVRVVGIVLLMRYLSRSDTAARRAKREDERGGIVRVDEILASREDK